MNLTLETIRNQYFIAIAENINWDELNRLGRKLTLQSNVVDEIVSSNRVVFDKCIKLLDKWYQKLGSKANLQLLTTFLDECGRRDMKENLGRILENSGNDKRQAQGKSYSGAAICLY